MSEYNIRITKSNGSRLYDQPVNEKSLKVIMAVLDGSLKMVMVNGDEVLIQQDTHLSIEVHNKAYQKDLHDRYEKWHEKKRE